MGKEKKNTEVSTEVVVNAKLADQTIYTLNDLKDIKSGAVRQAVKRFLAGEKKSFEGGWQMARSINKVVSGKEFKKDFATQNEFAAFMGISKSTLSKMIGVFSFEHIDFATLLIPLTVAYEYLPLKTEKAITEAMNELGTTASAAEVREYVKSLKGGKDEDKKIEDKESVSGKEEIEKDHDKLTNYNDEDGDELETEYTLPIWSDTNGGFVDEQVFMLTETEVEELAIFVREMMNKR